MRRVCVQRRGRRLAVSGTRRHAATKGAGHGRRRRGRAENARAQADVSEQQKSLIALSTMDYRGVATGRDVKIASAK